VFSLNDTCKHLSTINVRPVYKYFIKNFLAMSGVLDYLSKKICPKKGDKNAGITKAFTAL